MCKINLFQEFDMKLSLFLLPVVCLCLASCDTRKDVESARRENIAEVKTMNASDSSEDQKIIIGLREAIVSDETLSEEAKRIQIMAADGVVTLRGIVPTEKEKNEIAKKAKNLHGVKKVDDQLQIIRS